ncbi:MAG: glycerol kinase GlpK [Lachnospiraceae bacterium]|nr:glycerol kinase GlpK [Lachnospiraceae bacterium]
MAKQYILGVDQSTQGTKALLFNAEGDLICRADLPHEQIINEKGWVEHNPLEIYNNTIAVVKAVVDKAGIDKNEIAGLGISNQRETAVVWNRETGEPVYNAIVWQCARGEAICQRIVREHADTAKMVQAHTGLQLSPYFSAAKIAWVLEQVEGAKELAESNRICHGTVDSWLVYKLTGGSVYKTDYSNASRTQMYDVRHLQWDEEVCGLFGIDTKNLAEVCDSDSLFGETDFDGYLEEKIPIHAVLGDSHGALFGQGCLKPGMTKATYGTGSSVMMNIGEKPVFSSKGVVTSLAWGMGGKVNYVLEGNINYTGAVISWLQKDLKLISSAKESQQLAESANPADKTYLVPAFTGLGAPYWDSNATGIISGMTRTTGQAELVRAALDCIAYQITDIVKVMGEDAGVALEELRVDGGPTRNGYLMQFQSDMLGIPVQVPDAEELSGIGAAYAAGLALHIYNKERVFERMSRRRFDKQMPDDLQQQKYQGWKEAVQMVLTEK